MTEKRFKMKKLEYEAYFIDSQQEYVDEDEPNFKIDGEKTMSDSQILDLLNENEQLKQSYTKLKHRHGLLHDECLELEIKNDDLKQWQKEVFEVIDEKIKHYEHKPFSAPVGQPMSVNFDADVDRLARLSELQDLKKELQE